MDYIEFIKNLNSLYKKYFNESNGIKSSFNEKEAGYVGIIIDTISVKMPKGLDGIVKVLVNSGKKEYEEKGMYASLKVKGDLFVKEQGKTKLLPDEMIRETWNGTYKIDSLFKKFDGLFKEMLKLLSGHKKMNKISNIIFDEYLMK